MVKSDNPLNVVTGNGAVTEKEAPVKIGNTLKDMLKRLQGTLVKSLTTQWEGLTSIRSELSVEAKEFATQSKR